MTAHTSTYVVRFARDEADLRAAQRLRYRVFVEELGGTGPLVDHDARLEADALDPFFDHLLLIDPTRPTGDHVVGAYRLLRGERAAEAGGFYSGSEYDLSPLIAGGRKLLELGRSCLDPAHRGGLAMYHLWSALAAYVTEQEIDILFGVASFRGADIMAHAQALTLLHQRHLAPADLRVRARDEVYMAMDLVPDAQLEPRKAMLETPALIKAYLKLGGFVGEGAFVDAEFNTTDVCLILDTARMNAAQKAIYTREQRG